MAETLLAILLVNSSAKGSALVYHWPPDPVVPPRLRRALPSDLPDEPLSPRQRFDIDPSYRWERTNSSNRDRSLSYTHSPSSGRNTPAKDLDELENQEIRDKDNFENVFGYSSEFLAGILCPNTSMCHQKFQLIVDDLAFIGHPVCADSDGVWRFKPEKTKASSSRGRDSRNRRADSSSVSPARSSSADKEPSTKCAWLHTFHFVLVLDLPDPSSSATGNVSKYFDILYEQIGFIVTAVLYQEQVLYNFVEQECELLGSLKDECIRKGELYYVFSEQALKASSVAASMKTLYDAIKSSTMAYISIHELPLELQLPPYLDELLHSQEDIELDPLSAEADGEAGELWGPDMAFGWQLPALAPWKSLLLLDDFDEHGDDAFANLRSPYISPDDRPVVEGLLRFLDTVAVTLSLNDLASLLDWDLESQVFPTVRWLVQHRKAKVVDIINGRLKTVFTLPAKFNQPLSALTAQFAERFPDPSIPPLPQILSTISTSSAKQSGNHFFAAIVQSKELIPLYHQVVLWMLKRDMLIVLHLRVRMVATPNLKALAREEKERRAELRSRARKKEKKGRERGRTKEAGSLRSDVDEEAEAEDHHEHGHGIAWLSLSPKSARRHTRSSRVPSNESRHSQLSELIIEEDDDADDADERDEPDEGESADPSDGKDDADADADDEEEEAEMEGVSSMINDPGRATPLQRRWLSAMSLGKDPYIARRFDLINQYFDGKTSDDEILYRAEITRKQLREVLHHYDEYLQTFLHPS